MNVEYANAIDTRVRWLKSVLRGDLDTFSEGFPRGHRFHNPETVSIYRETLLRGDTFFMNRRFCELVDHARLTLPDDLAFEESWMLSRSGWLYVETPFCLPYMPEQIEQAKTLYESINHRPAPTKEEVYHLTCAAVGWTRLEIGEKAYVDDTNRELFTVHKPTYQFTVFVPTSVGLGFVPWSYFVIEIGQTVANRVKQFEDKARMSNDAAAYAANLELHEIRWTYTAMNLMSQRLATTLDESVDRHVRRRLERENVSIPSSSVKVVTLRRLEEARKQEGAAGKIDWQWQWTVRGHWRNQWCSASKTHKPVFIEAYIKGPEGKPLKPETQKLFRAIR